MSINMGSIDRMLRVFIVAPVAIVIALVAGAGSVAGIVLLAVAAIMLATSVVGFCPLYRLFGVDTRRAHSK